MSASIILSVIDKFYVQIVEIKKHGVVKKDILDGKNVGLKVMFSTHRPDIKHLTKALGLELDLVRLIVWRFLTVSGGSSRPK